MMQNEDEILRQTFGRDIPVSDDVENALNKAFDEIRRDANMQEARQTRLRKQRSKGSWIFKVAAAVCVLSLCTGGAVYAATQTDFLNSVFGTQGRNSASPQTVTYEFSDEEKAIGKQDFSWLMPGREFVDATSEELALVEPYVQEVNQSLIVDDYVITVLTSVTDGQRGAITFTVENPNGLPTLETESPGAILKGVKITDDLPLAWHITAGDEASFLTSKLSVDTQRCTSTCWYLTESYVNSASTNDDYASAHGGLDNLTLMVEQYNETNDPHKSQYSVSGSIDISSATVPSRSITLVGSSAYAVEKAAVERYRELSATHADMPDPEANANNSAALDFTVSPLGMKNAAIHIDNLFSLVLHYADGSTYVVLEREGETPMDNVNYLCGIEHGGFNLLFNRIVNWDNVVSVEINGQNWSVK